MKNESEIPEEIDKIIHEPARLKIILCLSVLRDADFNYLLYKTKLSRGNLSIQLQKLEAADYIEIEKQFINRVPRTLASLTDKGRKALRQYKDAITELLSGIDS